MASKIQLSVFIPNLKSQMNNQIKIITQHKIIIINQEKGPSSLNVLTFLCKKRQMSWEGGHAGATFLKMAPLSNKVSISSR